MKLSILIATHDYTCYKLVYDLHGQAEKLSIPYEIILLEDGSHDSVSMIANLKTTDLSNCKYIRQEAAGPAQARNRLAEIAQGEWIIFIDSDAKVFTEDYLMSYFKCIGKADVIVGGLKTLDAHLNPEVSLRYRYESKADIHRSAKDRDKYPYDKFSTFNFMIRRDTFMSIKFDKECHEYGYEDVLFGSELEKRGISILHIDNPLIHTGLDKNDVFLKKTETSLHTLKKLCDRMNGKSNIINTYNTLKKYHLTWMLVIFHTIFGKKIRKSLLGKDPSLFMFSVYKLGYYSSI